MSQQQIPQTPHLTPASLFDEQAKKDAIRLKIYNRILSAVHQKIRATSTLPNSTQMTSFDVPEWQPGCPRFDVKDCILYIVWSLRHAGFNVIYISPNRLLINWKEQTIQYYQEESPIRQAMMAAAAPPTQNQAKSLAKIDKKKPSYKPVAEDVAEMLVNANSTKRGVSTITFI